MACTHRFQSVTESGTSNSMTAAPSASVSRWGAKKAVSAKLERSSTAGSGVACGAVAEGATAASAATAASDMAICGCATRRCPSAFIITQSRRPGPPMP